jgi:uncharacterized membrane protein
MMPTAQVASSKTDWWIPAGLLLLSAVPIAAGTYRLLQLGGGAAITSENARFFSAPIPITIHIVSVSLFSVLGAFQFVEPIRSKWPSWHRGAGKWLVIAGITSALTGLWMTQFYPNPPGDGFALHLIRLVVGVAMAVSIVMGLTAIRRRDFGNHSAWMIRAYALGMGAGTQVLTHLPWFLIVGSKPTELPRAFLMGAGWAINLIIAEWILRRRRRA